MTHPFHQNRIRKVTPQYIGRTHLYTTVLHICPPQNILDNMSRQPIGQTFINIICYSFQIMEDF